MINMALSLVLALSPFWLIYSCLQGQDNLLYLLCQMPFDKAGGKPPSVVPSLPWECHTYRRKELTQGRDSAIRFCLGYKAIESLLFIFSALCFLSFSTLFLIWAVRKGKKLNTMDLKIMECLGGYCIKNSHLKWVWKILEDNLRFKLCTSQGWESPQAKEQLKCWRICFPPLWKHM